MTRHRMITQDYSHAVFLFEKVEDQTEGVQGETRWFALRVVAIRRSRFWII